LKANKVNLFVSSVLCVFWYHSPNVLDTLHICNISWLRVKDYHNRDFVDEEWRNLSQTLKFTKNYYYIAFAFSLYTNLCTDMQN
jgi:hypothetical protein